jgi:hypothetical protein
MPEIGTSGSMSGDGKRGVAEWPKLPRPSSTLPKRHLVRRKDMSEVEVKADMPRSLNRRGCRVARRSLTSARSQNRA